MGMRGPLSSAVRDYVVSLYVRGELATLDEGATIAEVTRATVLRWLVAADLDWRATRLRFLARHHSRAVAASEGRKVRRPSKQQLRRLADKAKRDWDNGHADHDLPAR